MIAYRGMFPNIRAVAIVAIVLSVEAFGQVKSNQTTDVVHISGRLVTPTGAAITGVTAILKELTGISYRDSKVVTDANGMFTFSAARGVLYQLPGAIREMEIIDGQEVALGDVVLGHFTGPIRISHLSSAPNSSVTTIAAIYIACSTVSDQQCDSGTVHIVLGDGSDIQPPLSASNEKVEGDGPVGGSSPRISKDRQDAGWLVEYGNCCTSYPLPLGLVIYRPGKPLRNIEVDCPSAIWDWRFEAGGTQVATYSNFPHGDYKGCYELREVETDRKLGTWEGDSASEKPAWVKRLND